MPQISVTVDAEVVRQGLQNLAAEVPKVGRLQLYLRAIRIRSRLAQPAPRPGYPINWVSERQRKAFFATDGFGGGIPHHRRGRYQRAWEVVKLDDGYRLVNRSPGANFIGGDAYGQGQSRIHAGTWPLFRQIVDEEIQNLDKDVADHINMVARRYGF